LAIIVFAPLTGECAPVCLLAASISVEAVTPPFFTERTVASPDCQRSFVLKIVGFEDRWFRRWFVPKDRLFQKQRPSKDLSLP